MGSPYTNLGVKKSKRAKAYNSMLHIPKVFERQMQEWIDGSSYSSKKVSSTGYLIDETEEIVDEAPPSTRVHR